MDSLANKQVIAGSVPDRKKSNKPLILLIFIGICAKAEEAAADVRGQIPDARSGRLASQCLNNRTACLRTAAFALHDKLG